MQNTNIYYSVEVCQQKEYRFFGMGSDSAKIVILFDVNFFNKNL